MFLICRLIVPGCQLSLFNREYKRLPKEVGLLVLRCQVMKHAISRACYTNV
jgi:hypothetical protein